jgi:hypothetical protein
MSQGAWLTTIVLMVLGALAPLAVQEIDGARTLLVMHWPVMLAGLAFGSGAGFLVAMATMAVAVLFLEHAHLSPEWGELIAYAVITGMAGREAPTLSGRTLGLAVAMLVGRLVVLLAMWQAPRMPSLDPSQMYPWQGVVLQVVALPALATLLARWLNPSPQLVWERSLARSRKEKK